MLPDPLQSQVFWGFDVPWKIPRSAPGLVCWLVSNTSFVVQMELKGNIGKPTVLDFNKVYIYKLYIISNEDVRAAS